MNSIIFIGAAIIGATQAIKYLVPVINGFWTIAIAVGIGTVVSLLDKHIGLNDITVVEGIMAGFSSVGAVTVATKVAVTPKV